MLMPLGLCHLALALWLLAMFRCKSPEGPALSSTPGLFLFYHVDPRAPRSSS
jgi:hypothetical protein